MPSSVEDVEEPGATGTPEPTSTPTPDEGWFSDLSNLVSNQVWFFVAIGAVLLFAAGAGIFFWRRAVRRRQRDNYTSLRDDEVALGRVGGAPRGAPRTTKELYDAFGEVSDDDDDDWTDSWLVTGCSDSSLRKWDLPTGRVLERMGTDKVRGERTLVWAVGVLGYVPNPLPVYHVPMVSPAGMGLLCPETRWEL